MRLELRNTLSALKGTFQTLLGTGGELAQMVERPLRMREVPVSIPGFSKLNFFGVSDQARVALSSFSVTSWITLFLNVKIEGRTHYLGVISTTLCRLS